MLIILDASMYSFNYWIKYYHSRFLILSWSLGRSVSLSPGRSTTQSFAPLFGGSMVCCSVTWWLLYRLIAWLLAWSIDCLVVGSVAWPLCHLVVVQLLGCSVAPSLGSLVIWSIGCLIAWSLNHLAASWLSHFVTLSLCHSQLIC
jgi:hypothetical protein